MNPASRLGEPARLAVRGGAVDLFVAGLALALVAATLSILLSAGARAYLAMTPRLGGELTVAVRSRGLESADAAAALAAERLSATPSVISAEPLEPDARDDLAGGAIFGARAPAGEVRLIAVTLKPGAPPGAASVMRALDGQGLAYAVDDHRGFSGALERTLALSAVGAAAGLVIVALLMVPLAWMAGRRQADRSAERFDLMRRLGAAPAFIGRIVSAVSWRSALGGAAVGALVPAAMVGLFGLGRLALVFPLLGAALKPAPVDMVAAAVWPVLLAVLAGVFAGAGARGVLARAERL